MLEWAWNMAAVRMAVAVRLVVHMAAVRMAVAEAADVRPHLTTPAGGAINRAWITSYPGPERKRSSLKPDNL